eukprot:9250877-Heterocapsa_arctica.AAC.1
MRLATQTGNCPSRLSVLICMPGVFSVLRVRACVPGSCAAALAMFRNLQVEALGFVIARSRRL